MSRRSHLASACLLASLSAATCLAAEPSEGLQLLRNGGFEEDELTFRGEPASSCGGHNNDQWYNQRDLFPDGWIWPGVNAPTIYGFANQAEWPLRDRLLLDTAVKRSGKQSLRLGGKDTKIQQTHQWNELVDLYKDLPRDPRNFDYTDTLSIKAALFADLKLTGFVRTAGVPDDAAGSVTLTLAGVPPVKFDLPKGTSEWQAFEIVLPAAAQSAVANNPGRTLDVTVAWASPSGAGQVWLDDLELTTPGRGEPNLLPNASFEESTPGSEASEPTGRGTELRGAAAPAEDLPYPKGWSKPRKWVYMPPPAYYVWNNWFHFFDATRGQPRLDSLVARTGQRSLRMELLGGDEYSLQSDAIALNQTEARPIEVTAWVKADRLKHFDIMLIDEEGRRLPTNATLHFWGGPLAGTHEWIAVRKVFQGYGPLKAVRLRFAGRGFNGTTWTDIGVWHSNNQVSQVWIDDVAVREVYATDAELAQRGVKVPEQSKPAPGVRVIGLDLGERLYGQNVARFWVHNADSEPRKIQIGARVVKVDGPGLQTPLNTEEAFRPPRLTNAKLVKPGETIELEASYTLDELSDSWRDPHQLFVGLYTADPTRNRFETYLFGTWPVIANVRPSKAFIDETENPILVAINLGVAEKTLAKSKTLTVEVVDRRTDKALIKQEIKDVPAAIASAQIPAAEKDRFYFYVPRAGLLDHRNLILQELDISKLPTRPWDNPEADYVIRVKGDGWEAVSHEFGRLTKMNETLPPIQNVTIDPKGKFFRVNGEPFFLMAQSHANGAGQRAPDSRKVSFSADRGKVNGLNAVGRWSGVDVYAKNWSDGNLYGPMLMSGYSPHAQKEPNFFATQLPALEQGQIFLASRNDDGKLRPITDVTQNPAALAYLVRYDEAILEAHTSPEKMKDEAAYAAAVKKKINRPVGIMDNHSQYYPWHDEDGYLDPFDALYFEREGGSVFRPWLTLRDWMKRKDAWVMVDLPQTYENVPHKRERYRALLNTLHGFRGWFGIQGCADPSLYRGLGGELRYIFHNYLASPEDGPDVTAPEGVVAKAWKNKDGRVLVIAEQHNPIPHGDWAWKDVAGKRAHNGASAHLVTPVKEGYAIHGYNDDVEREIAAGDTLVQEVYLDPAKTPKAILVIVPGNGGFNHVAYWGEFNHDDFRVQQIDAWFATECYSSAAYGINWKRAGGPEWPAYQASKRFPKEAFVRMGDLPKAGEWVTLSLPLDQLKLVGKVNDGLMFVSRDGEAWWGGSVLKRAAGREEVMLRDRIGRGADAFKTASISVEGLADADVRVVGELRSLRMKNGTITDDLRGEDLFDSFRSGYLGDGISYYQPVDALPERLELGYTYDDSPRCVRVYEIVPRK